MESDERTEKFARLARELVDRMNRGELTRAEVIELFVMACAKEDDGTLRA
jgi:hypothetical protein